MLARVSKFLRIKITYVNEGSMINTTGARPTLFPEQDNIERVMLQRGLATGSELSPLELSAFLYDFALKPNRFDDNPSLAMLLTLRKRDLTPEELKARRVHIQTTFETLIQLLRNNEAKTIPGATAAYAIFGAAKLQLDIAPHFQSLFWPIIKLKAKYLSSDELAALTWGLQSLGVSDAEVWKAVLPLFRGRRFACDLVNVKKDWFDHTKYVVKESANINSRGLLSEALPGLSTNSKEVAALAEEILAQLKNRQVS